MRVILSVAASFLALTSSLCAQTYVTGKVIKAPNVRCDATATHMLECTDVLLKSTAVNLTTWESKLVDLVGNLTTTGNCNTIDVTTIANATYSHTVTAANLFKLGTNVTFRGTGPALGFVAIVIAGGPGFLPASTYGTLLIDPTVYVLIGPNLALTGSYQTTIQIPNDPALVGGRIWSQSGWLNLTPTGYILNPACFTIVS